MNDAELMRLNREGIIPGPRESEVDFAARARYCFELQGRCASAESALFSGCEGGNAFFLKEAYSATLPFYDIAPTWVPIAFSNARLFPWHAGCAWIFQEEEGMPTGAVMQMRRRLKKRGGFLGLYRRDELIAHELAHVGRMLFEEPKFEELLACRCSPSAYRRWIGPLVQASWESLFFMLLLLLIFMLDLFLLSTGQMMAYSLIFSMKLLPGLFLLIAVVRLAWRQQQFQACLRSLAHQASVESAAPMAYRLTDAEIIYFAQASPAQAAAYIDEKKAQQSLRWRLISLAYLPSSESGKLKK